MRLSVSKSISGNRGNTNFVRRLLDCLARDYQVKIVKASEPSDIHLILIEGEMKRGARNVVRIDGVYYDAPRNGLNKPIVRTISKADGVVFQSKWSRTLAEKLLRVKPRSNTVIYNGVDPSVFRNSSGLERKFDKTFIACAHWRPNKRLDAITEAFQRFVELGHPNAGLIVVGEASAQAHPNMLFPGVVDEKKLAQLYSISDYMVHICHIDACPNSVVEALVTGLPVLCNNIGGTPEIVDRSGVIVKLDKQFEFKFIPSIKDVGSRSVDVRKLVDGMLQIASKDWEVKRPDLHIQTSAKRYYEYFRSLLSK